MITHIEITGFKSLKKLKLDLGQFNLFIGTNASGKSNFFDALRFLQGVGYGFTVDEILNGKPKSATSEVWDAIRGGSAKAAFVEKTPEGIAAKPQEIITFSVHLRGKKNSFQYSIGIDPEHACLRSESFRVDGGAVYDSKDLDNSVEEPTFAVKHFHGKRGTQPRREFEKTRPVLHQFKRVVNKELAAQIEECVRLLSNLQRIDPLPAVLREYSRAQSVRRMGEHGENFAALVKTILSDEENKSAYLAWLQQLTPTEVDDVVVLSGALGEPLFALKEQGMDYPAPILSDGTLRFAAITAAFFQPDMPDVITIEEIENGIHPTRLRLLVELLKTQARQGRQVMATTHSPIVLEWLREEDYTTTYLCTRDSDTNASDIRPLSKVPRFLELAKSQDLGELFAEGWMEGAT